MGTPSPKSRLEDLIAASGRTLDMLTPEMGLDLMTGLYLEDPSAWQMLSCTWGKVTRYGPEEIGYSMTCWPVDVDDEPSAPRLTLSFKFGPKEAVAGEGPGRWPICCDPADLQDFRALVERAPAWQTWARRTAAAVALVAEDVVHSAYDLFDCWGARDPKRPIVAMTEAEWRRSDDTGLMIRWFRQKWPGDQADLDRLLQRYCIACCRRIWRLLPHPGSRAGVEVAERYNEGLATSREFHDAEWLAEGAAFQLEPDSEPDEIPAWAVGIDPPPPRITPPEERAQIDRWCDEVAAMPTDDLALLQPTVPDDDLTPRGLLSHAAFFADHAICYVGIRPKESIEGYRLFLPAELLREIVGNPFVEGWPSPSTLDPPAPEPSS